MLVNASAIARADPASGSIKALAGACPIEVATPWYPVKSSAETARLFKGN
ncbi:hypothetical protein ES705_43727 [subsurface metagenome]